MHIISDESNGTPLTAPAICKGFIEKASGFYKDMTYAGKKSNVDAQIQCEECGGNLAVFRHVNDLNDFM